MTPNASTYTPGADTIRALLDECGLSQAECARRIGLTPRALQYYLTGQRTAPYTVQFALECLRT